MGAKGIERLVSSRRRPAARPKTLEGMEEFWQGSGYSALRGRAGAQGWRPQAMHLTHFLRYLCVGPFRIVTCSLGGNFADSIFGCIMAPRCRPL